jgi:hypothetical protein
MVLLDDSDLTQEEVEATYQPALADEQSNSIFLTEYPISAGVAQRKGDQLMNVRIPNSQIESGWQPNQVE